MRGLTDLRVIDFGRVSAIRSQTLWHAIAHGVSRGAPATLSFMQPRRPYVSIGFHRHLSEIDTEWCADRSLPIFRRMVGGGPVYLDDGQYFFQLTVPAANAPAVRARAVRSMLAPAVAAFHAAGIGARLDTDGEVVVGDQKICGHGAGQIDDAVIVVGNLITAFDHAAAASIMAAPGEHARAEVERMMRRYVRPTRVDPDGYRAAAIDTYAGSLGATVRAGELRPDERDRLAELDELFADEAWVGDAPPRRAGPWTVKIKSGVWVTSVADEQSRVTISAVDGVVVRMRIEDARLNGESTALAHQFLGAPMRRLRRRAGAVGVPANVNGLLEQLEGTGPR